MCLLPDGVQVVVLDEADKMLSLGFEPQLTRLRRRLCPPQSRAPPSYQRPQVEPPSCHSPQDDRSIAARLTFCILPHSICRLTLWPAAIVHTQCLSV